MTQAYGYDVLEIEPNTDQDRSSTYRRALTVFDCKTGKIRATDRSGVAIVAPQGFSWLMSSRAEIDAYRQFLDLRKGSCRAFWIPSWQHDLLLAADVAANSVAVVVRKIGYTGFMFPSPARRYLAFTMLDGTGARYYRKVVGATDGASTESLTLDAPVRASAAIVAAQCMVSFLTLARLATDDPELIWSSRDVAEVVLDYVELPLEVTA